MRVDSGYFFKKGIEYFKIESFLLARDSFEMCKNDKRHKKDALKMLAKIDMREGKIKDARDRILNNFNLENNETMYLLSILENMEYNYEKSFYLVEKSYMEDKNAYKWDYQKAIILLNMGDLIESQKLFLKCKEHDDFWFKSICHLIIIELINDNINEAYKLFKGINKKRLNSSNRKFYYDLYLIFNYLFHVDLKGVSVPIESQYLKSILMSEDDEKLFNHISYHKSGANKELVFFKDLDFKELLKIIRNNIKTYKPDRYHLAEYYRFNLDQNIGVYNGRNINGLTAIVVPGTDKVLTVFPSDFSSEFDKEGHSKILK